MTAKVKNYDALVVGGGLSGLISALYIQQAGYKVGIIEKRKVLGGLCGTQTIDGYEFVLGANEFGMGLSHIFQELGIVYEFVKVKNWFFFDQQKIQLPPNFGTLRSLLPYVVDFWRLGRLLKLDDEATLGEMMLRGNFTRPFSDLIHLLSYTQGIPPRDLTVRTIKGLLSKNNDCAYDKILIPKGGPKQMVDVLTNAFKERGGHVFINTTYHQHQEYENWKHIATSRGVMNTKVLVSSVGRWSDYPTKSRTGLAVSMLCIALDKKFQYPNGVHSISFFPSKMHHWLGLLDRGKLPEAFGFHLFKSDLSSNKSYQSVNVHFYTPRNQFVFKADDVTRLKNHLFTEIEKVFPTFQQHILHQRLIAPQEYDERNQLKPVPVPLIAPKDFIKPQRYDSVSGTYHIGNSVLPHGEHAGGAILSGKRAALEVVNKLRNE